MATNPCVYSSKMNHHNVLLLLKRNEEIYCLALKLYRNITGVQNLHCVVTKFHGNEISGMFVCFESVTAFVPQGQLPREDLRRAPLPSRPLVSPGPRCSSCPLSPHTYVMHPASGQYPPPSSCPVQISYQISGLPPPCLRSCTPTHIFNPHKYETLEPHI